jgi:hypothetical protein
MQDPTDQQAEASIPTETVRGREGPNLNRTFTVRRKLQSASVTRNLRIPWILEILASMQQTQARKRIDRTVSPIMVDRTITLDLSRDFSNRYSKVSGD